MKVLITGANGFIGKNLSTQLLVDQDTLVLPFVRESNKSALQSLVAEADLICHLAGANRSADTGEFVRTNTDLTRTLCQAVAKSGHAVPIIFASSIHANRDDSYGRSKLAAERELIRHSEETGSPVYIFRLPSVMGKWCRPNYNSVVATFCHNIARNLPIRIDDPDQELDIVFIDDVIVAFRRIMRRERQYGPYCEVQPIYQISVGMLAEQLQAFRASRSGLLLGPVGAGWLRALYATYVSYIPPTDFVYELPKHEDPRGYFVEILKTLDSGQFSFFTAKPGVTRGGHYHHTKSEKFLVVKGKARFRFRHVLTQELHEVSVSGDKSEIVDTVPGWSHDISNVGDEEMLVLIWANEVFDRERSDTFVHPL